MDFEAQIRLIQAAAGDPKAMALALLETGPAATGTDLRRALTCAAVPRWFDAEILAKVLDPDLAPDADAWLGRLQALGCVEGFPARNAWNVHETTRLALREALQAQDPARMAALATRAMAAFPGEAMPERIERAYHLVLADPGDYKTLRLLSRDAMPMPAQGTALAQVLSEYSSHPGWPDRTRAWAFVLRAWHLAFYRPNCETITDARAGLALFEGVGPREAVALALHSLAFALARGGRRVDLDEAKGHWARALTLGEGLLAQDPDSTLAAYDLSQTLRQGGSLIAGVHSGLPGPALQDEALACFERGIALAEALMARDPDSTWSAWTLSRHLEGRGWLLARRGADGDRQVAEADYRRTIQLRKEILAKDSRSSLASWGLSRVLSKLAHLLAQGDVRDQDAELALREECVSIAQQQVLAEPGSAHLYADLAVFFDRLWKALKASGGPRDLDRAIARYERRLAITEALVADDPRSSEVPRNLWLGYWRMAEIAEQAGGGQAQG